MSSNGGAAELIIAERFFTVLVNDVLDAVFGLQVPD